MNVADIENIIFDMDGVIIDSNPAHIEAEKQTFAKFNLDVPEEEWQSFKGRTHHDILSTVIAKYGTADHDVDTLLTYRTKIYMKTASRTELIPGVNTFIRKARKRYKKLAITTSSKRTVLQASLPRHNILDNFDIIVTGDQIKHGKPDPEPYIITLEKLHVPASKTLVIEDADNGVISAKKAGCFVAAITTSCTKHELLNAGADIICDSYKELEDQLNLSQVQ